MVVESEKAGEARGLIGRGRVAGLGNRTVGGLAAMRQAIQTHVWRWCSGTRWNRDEKDRVMVVAPRELAETVVEAQWG